MKQWTGILQLVMEKKKERTVTKTVYFQGALKVMRPNYLDSSGQACFFVINPGGGYVGGDRYRIEVTLEENAELILTTQSATKVYRTLITPVLQETEFILKKGSVLEYIPDPLIAYRDAKYHQNTVIRMEKGSTLLYTDILTPGWSPNGEWFKYDYLRLKNEIYMDDELIAFDHLKLEPSDSQVEDIGFMESYTHLGSMLVVDERCTPSFLHQLYEQLEDYKQGCTLGMSMLYESGCTIRILGSSTQQIEEILAVCTSFIRREWFTKKPMLLRKY
ncbi:urease accessory protein UreD [Psychrobacillus sp. NPDC096426]|uniref:urease accessory protein UreD n=1 Tax=Psychrobacillus sp. NPDC096426 TaxID=3364491 RepID=UPI003827EA38